MLAPAGAREIGIADQPLDQVQGAGGRVHFPARVGARDQYDLLVFIGQPVVRDIGQQQVPAVQRLGASGHFDALGESLLPAFQARFHLRNRGIVQVGAGSRGVLVHGFLVSLKSLQQKASWLQQSSEFEVLDRLRPRTANSLGHRGAWFRFDLGILIQPPLWATI